MADTYENFDYVRMADDHFFLLNGDHHPGDQLIGMATYGPDPDGDRVYDGVRLGKVSRTDLFDIPSSYYTPSTVDFLSVEMPGDWVQETMSPVHDRERVLDHLDDWKEDLLYRIEDNVAPDDVDISVIGSDVWGIATDDSDMDVLWVGDFDGFGDDHDEALQERTPLEGFPDGTMEQKYDKYADRYEMPRDAAAHHLEHPERRFRWPERDIKVSIIPSQEPGTWTDYHVPGHDEVAIPVDGLEAEVVDATHGSHMPRGYTVAAGEKELDVLTYFWIYAGSFEEGDSITVTGDLFPDADTIYLREKGHYAEPSESSADE